MANAQKTPLVRSLNLFAQRKALDEIRKRGYALPGHVTAISGSIVTVSFDVQGLTLPQVTMPLFGPEYVRYPIQVGDKGCAFPQAVSIAAISGLGTGTADTTLRGNLATLVWFPVASKEWAAPSDANALELYGPNGVILRDKDKKTVATLTPSGLNISAQDTYQITAGSSITLQVGGKTIVIDSSGVSIEGKQFLAHEHEAGTYVTTDGPVTGVSGEVV